MRIIFLNSWFAKAGDKFFEFIREESSTTDIFCLMEIDPDLYVKLKDILTGFKGIYGKGVNLAIFNLKCGQAIFFKKSLEVLTYGQKLNYRRSKKDAGFMEYAQVESGHKSFWLGSVHGKSHPGTKFDTLVRLRQSEKIIDFFKDKEGPKIIGGDFNLNLETQSIAMFEKAGYRNLIKDFNIKSTRNQVSWDQFANTPGYIKQYFADFCFVSPGVKVNNFEVPYNEISDHLPLILDFEL